MKIMREKSAATRRASCAREQIVRDAPFFSARVAPQLLAREKENSPARKPASSFSLPRSGRESAPISLAEDFQNFVAMRVHVPPPRVGCLLVVRAANAPLPQQTHVALEVKQQILARHHPAGEKIFRHPIRGIARLKQIREAPVRENVHEKPRV